MLQDGFHRRILENLTTGIVLVGPDMRVRYLNPSAEMMLAVSRSRAVDHHLGDIFCELGVDTPLASFERTLRTGHPFTKREAHLRVGLSEVVFDYSVMPVNMPGEAQSLLLELQQMDRLVRISREEALLANHQATRQLIRGVAHEIKNPLGGIRGAAQLLARALPNEELKDYTNIIIEETDRLRNLADRMLGPRKLPQKQPVNIHECLERVRSLILVEAEGRVAIVRDYDPSLPELLADPDQLIQALLNIAGNAMQALLENQQPQESPRITFRTRPLRQFTIGSMRHRLVARIDIVDNGPGIPADMLETIFYPMVSGRASGTGLGLSIAQDIISQYHGLIECESRPGQTVFSILLPLELDHDDK